MMKCSVIFDPPVTIEECRIVGAQFGKAWGGRPRVAFEQALVKRLVVLSEALAASGLDPDEVVAAFDQAAWTEWEEVATPMEPRSRI
jgi:hypothetical protein